MIEGTKAVHEAMQGNKGILPEEQPTIDFAYACVVTIKPIKKGEEFNMDNLWVKRPGTGEIKADKFKSLLGKKASRDISKDIHLKLEDIT